MRTCLLVVDLQRGFIGEHTSHIVGSIRTLLEQDLFSNIIYTKFRNVIDSHYSRFLDWHDLSTGAEQEIIPELQHFAHSVFLKMSYGIANTDLSRHIKAEMFDAVFVVGVDTDGCVLKTALDLFDDEIRTFVLQDYCASTGGAEFHQAAIKVLRRLLGNHHVIEGRMDRYRYQAAISFLEAFDHGKRSHF